MPSPNLLRRELHKILAMDDLAPAGGNTYCNIAVYQLLKAFGLEKQVWNSQYNRPMTANESFNSLKAVKTPLNTDQAYNRSKMGEIVLAALPGPVHGHIATLYPYQNTQFSGKWSKPVPFCANVGKDIGVMGVNWAFEKEPLYFPMG